MWRVVTWNWEGIKHRYCAAPDPEGVLRAYSISCGVSFAARMPQSHLRESSHFAPISLNQAQHSSWVSPLCITLVSTSTVSLETSASTEAVAVCPCRSRTEGIGADRMLPPPLPPLPLPLLPLALLPAPSMLVRPPDPPNCRHRRLQRDPGSGGGARVSGKGSTTGLCVAALVG